MWLASFPNQPYISARPLGVQASHQYRLKCFAFYTIALTQIRVESEICSIRNRLILPHRKFRENFSKNGNEEEEALQSTWNATPIFNVLRKSNKCPKCWEIVGILKGDQRKRKAFVPNMEIRTNHRIQMLRLSETISVSQFLTPILWYRKRDCLIRIL